MSVKYYVHYTFKGSYDRGFNSFDRCDIVNVDKPICSLDDIWKLENIVEKQEEVYGVHILSFSKME